MADEPESNALEPSEPTGEVLETPEIAEEPGSAAAPQGEEPEAEQDLSQLQRELEGASDPDERAATQEKLNSAFAANRRKRQAAEQARIEAEKQAAYYKGLAEARAQTREGLTDTAPKADAPIEVQLPERPKVDDYESDEDYFVALGEWGAECRLLKRDAEKAQTERTKEQERAVQDRQNWHQQGKAKFPDFDRVVTQAVANGLVNIPVELGMAITASDVGHEIAYHLLKNPAELQRLSGLPGLQQIKEVGKLEVKFTAPKPQPKTKTDAPEPITPLSGATVNDVPLEKLSTKDYIARRNREEFGPNWKG